MSDSSTEDVAVRKRFIMDGWPRAALRLHLALTPSSMGTAFMLVRFARASRGLQGRERGRARRIFLRKRGVSIAGVLRLAFHDVLERRGWILALGLLMAFALVGGVIGRVVRSMLGDAA